MCGYKAMDTCILSEMFKIKQFVYNTFTKNVQHTYCDMPGSPCLSKKRVKCTVCFFFKFL